MATVTATTCTLFLSHSLLPSSSSSKLHRRCLCRLSSSFSTINPSPTLPLPFQRSRTEANITRSNRSICCLSVDYDRPSGAAASASDDKPPSGLRVVFTGGGTGGHIYPAIAIAEEIKNARPDAAILFVGTAAGIESTAVPAAGYDFAAVPQTRLYRPIVSPLNLFFPFHLLASVAASLRVLCKFRPQIVVGTGGYAAAPVCLAAALAGVKIVIQEQNSYPGLTSRVIAPFAGKIFLAFNGCVKYFEKKKCLVYGNPIRQSLRRSVHKAAARAHFFPKMKEGEQDKAQVVLVLGGSGGSAAINIAVLNMYFEMLRQHKNRYIIWQTGADGFSEMESLVQQNRRLLLTPFLKEMDLAYAAADVVVSRSGAMSCAEIMATGKPSIMIPLPTAADDHQTKNAYIMADIAGSKVLTEDELDSSSLQDAIDLILGNRSVMAVMSERALNSARPNASLHIAQCILSLVEVSSRK